MNDILPKPFTRDGLMGILEKHLMHLKQIRQMTTRIPRSMGESDNSLSAALTLPDTSSSPPLPQNSLSRASGPSSSANGGLNSSSSSTSSHRLRHPSNGVSVDSDLGAFTSFSHITSEQDGPHRINPLAGLGLSVEQYPIMLQNLLGMTGDALDGVEFEGDDVGGSGGRGGVEGSGGHINPGGVFGGVMMADLDAAAGGAAGSASAKRGRGEGGYEDGEGVAGGGGGLGNGGRNSKRSRFEVVD